MRKTAAFQFFATIVLSWNLSIVAAPRQDVFSETTSHTATAPKTAEINVSNLELAMSPGMRIEAQTTDSQIAITAGKGLKREFTWEGATRSLDLWPRRERWNGSLGAYYPGPGDHWKEHNGITRGVIEEGQQHFRSLDEATHWLQEQAKTNANLVYRTDGLVVFWSKNLSRRALEVSVWQIKINGRKPTSIPGSSNANIRVKYNL